MLHRWICTIVFTAFVCFVMLTLTPQSRIRRAEELICGIVMITAILSAVANLDMSSYSEYLAKYRDEGEKITQSGAEYSKNLNRTIIEENTEAYILDKAESMGTTLSDVKVEAEWSLDSCWYPRSALLKGDCTEEETEILARWMESELGITREMQTWN